LPAAAAARPAKLFLDARELSPDMERLPFLLRDSNDRKLVRDA
jgi:hypothetical protein